ncbi:hypothetical protein D5H75_17550 [Bailinhaonella thermotolerans]|uniref:N-acetyltransferase domain-containing protein n=1 Tax=Bailinhaonella thermotolerans TaxID=1070861 RepID=A0A3A4BMF7_9ACTN|nr:hypothetical protein D5H75_17550 [Bailinhaonella thermotolerans]
MRPATDDDRSWIQGLGYISDPAAFVAHHGLERVGFAVYSLDGDHCRLLATHSRLPGLSVPTSLLSAVTAQARSNGCTRLWQTLTNDNIEGLRFYQARGWDLAALHRNTHPGDQKGRDAIPIRHELELEVLL